MKEPSAERLSLKNPSVRMIDSREKNLQYIVCDDGDGIVISGLYGMTGLTLEQAKAVCSELPEMIEIYLEGAR